MQAAVSRHPAMETKAACSVSERVSLFALFVCGNRELRIIMGVSASFGFGHTAGELHIAAFGINYYGRVVAV